MHIVRQGLNQEEYRSKDSTALLIQMHVDQIAKGGKVPKNSVSSTLIAFTFRKNRESGE